ncbi:DNA replication licensing factor Mcm2 [Corchorus olitorius]|uniref:DNA replication licensing factor Mcm2 n=1 Tax=Corchorus olitorius TaxID=93759 RepID=A0A1R3I989_9ROSI|nr:DNA replication licensing factor Mcm2 [Corchorus olitorius]
MDDSLEDERDLDQNMQDRRAAELELDTRDARLSNRKLPQLLHDQDDDNYRPSKRSRADFRPPTAARSYDDIDGMQSSLGRSQQSHSRDDVPMTDRTTDDYGYEDEDDQGNFEMYHIQGTLRRMHMVTLNMYAS